MATITSILRLQERVSGPIRTVISSLRGADTAFQRLHASSANAIDTGSLAQARESLNGMRQAVNNVDAGFDGVGEKVRRAADEQGRFNRQMQAGGDSASRLLGTIRGMVGAYIGLNAVKGFVALSDTLTQTTARLNMLTGGMEETLALQDAIFASAQRSRGSYQDSADAVAKMGLLAGNAFSDTGELVRFTELINKQFTIAGTSAEGVRAAMLQLTQAMGSGVLRGEELNSVLEQAPNIVHTIADSLGVGVGQVRQMAADGEITAEVVKNAMLGAADKINEQFESMPMTWGQAWTAASNMAIRAFEPALNKLNAFLATDTGQAVFQGLITGIAFLGQTVEALVDGFQRGADFVVANWNIIGPLLIGGAIAVGGAFLWAGIQAGAAWIAATWPFLLVIALIGALILGLHESGVSWTQMGQVAGAVIGGVYAVLYNLVSNAWNLLATFAEFFANVWTDPVGSVVRLFAGMADSVLGLLQTIANGIDAVFGSNLSGAVAGWRAGLSAKVTATFGEGKVKIPRMEQLDIRSTAMQGYRAGGDFIGGISGFADQITKTIKDYTGVPIASNGISSDVGDIKGNTGKLADSMDFAEEDLKYLRDLAEQDVINRFTTAEIKVDMGGIYNQVSSDTDLDGIVDYLAGGIYGVMETAAEGVHA